MAVYWGEVCSRVRPDGRFTGDHFWQKEVLTAKKRLLLHCSGGETCVEKCNQTHLHTRWGRFVYCYFVVILCVFSGLCWQEGSCECALWRMYGRGRGRRRGVSKGDVSDSSPDHSHHHGHRWVNCTVQRFAWFHRKSNLDACSSLFLLLFSLGSKHSFTQQIMLL